MDGNGRWAKKRFLPRPAGHKMGVESAKNIIEIAAKTGIRVLTLFVFSPENWRRPQSEINAIFQLFLRSLTEDIQKLHQNNIKLRIIGNIADFSDKIQHAIYQAETLTQNNTGMTLVLAANYGGLWDLTQAVQAIASKIKSGDINDTDITQETIRAHLTTADLPDPDLFIRTSGEQRISNFYLWQLSYSELYFTDVTWPDFNALEFNKALDYFANRERRYGHTSEQLYA